MTTYFLDTSAPVKRHIAEPSHVWVDAICDPTSGNDIVISEASLVEVVSAFSRMARENPPRVTPAERDQVIADFEALAATENIAVTMRRPLIDRAARLCRAYPLRAYDAVQLASALTRRDDDLATGNLAPIFVCADAALVAVAAAEGFATDDPNNHP